MFKIGSAPKSQLPKFRVYIAEEPGAKLVRHGHTSSLKKALVIVAKFATAIDYEIRSFYNGQERVVNIDHVTML
jgi:hypothetical protein